MSKAIIMAFIFGIVVASAFWVFGTQEITVDVFGVSDRGEYRTPEEQKAFFEGRDIGYQEGYEAAKHNLSYGVRWERLNFTCADGKNGSEQINNCIRD